MCSTCGCKGAEDSDISKNIFGNMRDAKKRAKQLGTKQIHSHDLNGDKVFMPFKTHQEYQKNMGAESFDDEIQYKIIEILATSDDELLIEVADERMVWRIDLEDAEDVYELFGKSAKYPAKVGKAIRKGKKIDFGKIIFGVQKDGYHEYKLEGEKFETRIHFRVVPIEEQNRWIAWTGKKQEMLDPEDDEGVWIISEDKYADLEFP